ncbi:unnamed protein product [Moneuplotes crassus]|uniref:Uncharacterized protein n=1 Tax=Euplotes crassus TaxID=5936 RepID=A0AAD1U3Y7_EUPCR|nr:unnamed protein product [Moneuplotes crassus]
MEHIHKSKPFYKHSTHGDHKKKAEELLKKYCQGLANLRRKKGNSRKNRRELKVNKTPGGRKVLAEGGLVGTQKGLNTSQRAYTPFIGDISRGLMKENEFQSCFRVPSSSQMSQYKMERKRRLNKSQQMKRRAYNNSLISSEGVFQSTINKDSAMNYFKPKKIDMSQLKPTNNLNKMMKKDSDIFSLENKLGYYKTESKKSLKGYLNALRSAQMNLKAAEQHTKDILSYQNSKFKDSAISKMKSENIVETPTNNEYAVSFKEYESNYNRKNVHSRDSSKNPRQRVLSTKDFSPGGASPYRMDKNHNYNSSYPRLSGKQVTNPRMGKLQSLKERKRHTMRQWMRSSTRRRRVIKNMSKPVIRKKRPVTTGY